MSISPENRSILVDILNRDKNSGFHQLTYYLKSIVGNRPITIETSTGFIDLPANEAWDAIETWANDTSTSLPMGDRGNRNFRAQRLLNYLEINIQGKTREAAAAHQAILESVRLQPLRNAPTANVSLEAKRFKKLYDLRNEQYKILEAKFLGKLRTNLEKSSYLKRFKNDPYTYSVLSGLLAANSSNLRTNPKSRADTPNTHLANEIASVIQYRAGDGATNNASHLAYSSAARDGDGELAEVSQIINDTISDVYGKNEKGYQKDLQALTSLTHVTSAASVPYLVELVAQDASENTRAQIAHSLRSTILETLDSDYVPPEQIIKRAAERSGVPSEQLDHLLKLAPIVEEIRMTELHHTLTGNLREKNSRLLHTLNTAVDAGVSPQIPWLDPADLDYQAVTIIKKYHLKETDSFSNILENELSKGDQANFDLISDLTQHLDNRIQHREYQTRLSEDSLLSLRHTLGKIRGNLSNITDPPLRFYEKTNKQIFNIYNTLNTPFDRFGTWLIDVQDKFPILNPAKFINDKISSSQLWVADKLLNWSKGLSLAKTSSGGSAWYAGIFSQIHEFTHGFIESEANWSDASFHFIKAKFGNLLDWGAKKAGYAGFQAVKAKIGKGLWDGFAKMAPGLAAKLNTGNLAGIIATFTAGELTMGTSILLQVGAAVLWEGVKGLFRLIKDLGDPSKISKAPLYMAIGSAIGALTALPGLITGGIIALGSALLGGLAAIASSLLAIFLPATIIAITAVGITTLISNSGDIVARLDVSTNLAQIITDLACEDSSGNTVGGDSPTLPEKNTITCADCLVKYLTQCYGPVVTGTKIKSKPISCIIASIISPDSATAIAASATRYDYLQCIGFARAAAVCAGNDLPGQAVASDYIRKSTPGYTFSPGVSSCQPGDLGIVDGLVGHIFVVHSIQGGLVRGLDANRVSNGYVSNNTPIPTSLVAGCLKKN